jgi:hypothetical protein
MEHQTPRKIERGAPSICGGDINKLGKIKVKGVVVGYFIGLPPKSLF